jgi:hypothetical protein
VKRRFYKTNPIGASPNLLERHFSAAERVAAQIAAYSILLVQESRKQSFC